MRVVAELSSVVDTFFGFSVHKPIQPGSVFTGTRRDRGTGVEAIVTLFANETGLHEVLSPEVYTPANLASHIYFSGRVRGFRRPLVVHGTSVQAAVRR